MNLQRPNLDLPFKPRVLVVAGAAVLLIVILIAVAVWPSSGKPEADPLPALPSTQKILCGGEGEWACRRFRAPGPDHLWREFEGPVWLEKSFPLTDARWSS